MSDTPHSVSVIVITMSRPKYVEDCLSHLARSTVAPHEVIVVDGSQDDRTRILIETSFPQTTYLHHNFGRGTMPESRQLGLSVATGDIVAFIDDDANVDPQWLSELVAPYADPSVVGVGGRAANGIQGEETVGLGSIGRLLPNGTLTGNFAADPGRTIEVDHLLGANMSFRRDALLAIGGIRGNYPGTCVCEESDISLRLKARGGRLVFTPSALVHHVAAPYQIGGKRFDRRYQYYASRNHVVLLSRVYGFRSELVRNFAAVTVQRQRRFVREAVRRVLGQPGPTGARPSTLQRLTAPVLLTRSLAELSGLVAGFPAAATARRRDRREGVATP